jgi:hypothetical protein
MCDAFSKFARFHGVGGARFALRLRSTADLSRLTCPAEGPVAAVMGSWRTGGRCGVVVSRRGAEAADDLEGGGDVVGPRPPGRQPQPGRRLLVISRARTAVTVMRSVLVVTRPRGCDVWVAEGIVEYGEGPVHIIGIVKITDGMVVTADFYFADFGSNRPSPAFPGRTMPRRRRTTPSLPQASSVTSGGCAAHRRWRPRGWSAR